MRTSTSLKLFEMRCVQFYVLILVLLDNECTSRKPNQHRAARGWHTWGRLRAKAAMYGSFAFFTMLSSKYSAGSFCSGSACDGQRIPGLNARQAVDSGDAGNADGDAMRADSINGHSALSHNAFRRYEQIDKAPSWTSRAVREGEVWRRGGGGVRGAG